jgi:hypothetical protein
MFDDQQQKRECCKNSVRFGDRIYQLMDFLRGKWGYSKKWTQL